MVKQHYRLIYSAFFACAAAYYGGVLPAAGGFPLSRLFFPLLAAAAVPFSLALAVTAFPGRRRRMVLLHAAAAAIGLCVGFAAALSVPAGMRPGMQPERITAVSGTLLEDPRLSTGRRGIGAVELDHCYGGGLKVSAAGKAVFLIGEEHYARLKSFGRGCRVYVEGRFAGGKRGAADSLFIADSLHVTAAAPPLERLRTALRLRVTKVFDSKGEWGGLALALILGIKDNLDSGLSALYRDAGCSHVLALSGMHLAVVSAIAAFILKKPLGCRAAAAAGMVFVFCYVFLIGDVPSLKRAAIMYALGALAVLAFLPRDPLAILALSFMIQIGIAPESGTSASFLLSYLALWGILSVGVSLAGVLRGTVPAAVSTPLSASIGAFAATAAVSAAFFGALRPAGIAAGLAVVPISTVFMIGAIISLALGFVFPAAAAPVDFILGFLYKALAGLVSWAGKLPGIVFEGEGAGAPLVTLAASLCFAAIIIAVEKRLRAYRNRVASFA